MSNKCISHLKNIVRQTRAWVRREKTEFTELFPPAAEMEFAVLVFFSCLISFPCRGLHVDMNDTTVVKRMKHSAGNDSDFDSIYDPDGDSNAEYPQLSPVTFPHFRDLDDFPTLPATNAGNGSAVTATTHPIIHFTPLVVNISTSTTPVSAAKPPSPSPVSVNATPITASTKPVKPASPTPTPKPVIISTKVPVNLMNKTTTVKRTNTTTKAPVKAAAAASGSKSKEDKKRMLVIVIASASVVAACVVLALVAVYAVIRRNRRRERQRREASIAAMEAEPTMPDIPAVDSNLPRIKSVAADHRSVPISEMGPKAGKGLGMTTFFSPTAAKPPPFTGFGLSTRTNRPSKNFKTSFGSSSGGSGSRGSSRSPSRHRHSGSSRRKNGRHRR